MMMDGEPDEEYKVTEDYPGFMVHDGRVCGSITVGETRLPLWCLIQEMVAAGYAAAVESYEELASYTNADEIGYFLYDLLEQRCEFGRLLCVLADVQRRERQARWKESGPNTAYLVGDGSQVQEEIGPALARTGPGPILAVDPQNLPPALQPWYSDSENTSRVRAALRNCLNELDRLETRERDRTSRRL